MGFCWYCPPGHFSFVSPASHEPPRKGPAETLSVVGFRTPLPWCLFLDFSDCFFGSPPPDVIRSSPTFSFWALSPVKHYWCRFSFFENIKNELTVRLPPPFAVFYVRWRFFFNPNEFLFSRGLSFSVLNVLLLVVYWTYPLLTLFGRPLLSPGLRSLIFPPFFLGRITPLLESGLVFLSPLVQNPSSPGFPFQGFFLPLVSSSGPFSSWSWVLLGPFLCLFPSRSSPGEIHRALWFCLDRCLRSIGLLVDGRCPLWWSSLECGSDFFFRLTPYNRSVLF